MTVRIIEIAVGIGLLIMIHELGHFLAAKWAGVRVDKFALGMGPKLFWFTRGETEYSIRIIPFGGFVAMAGEEPGSETSAPPERQFRAQKPGRRAVILFSGVFMNFVLGIVLFSVALGFGVMFTRPLVGYVEPMSPAEKAGLLPGDQVTGIDGQKDVDWEDVRATILLSDPGDNVTLTVTRNGKPLRLIVRPEKPEGSDLPVIGVMPATGRTITKIVKDSPAARAGLRPDDTIDTIDGTRFLNWEDALFHVSARIGKPVTFTVTRAGGKLDVNVVPAPGRKGYIGILPKTYPTAAEIFPDQPGMRGGVRVGDQVLEVDGRPTPTIDDVVALTASGIGKPTVYTLRRGDEVVKLTLTPEARPGEPRGRLGVAFAKRSDFVVGSVEPGSPAEAAGIRPGDVLTSLNGKPLEDLSWKALQFVLNHAAGGDPKVTLTWRTGESDESTKTLDVRVIEDDLHTDIGIAVNPEIQWLRKYPPHTACVVGLKKSWQMVEQVYLFLRGIVTRRISPKYVAGPVGIAQISYVAASQGITKFIFWLAILGVNIAVVNLLPIPPFDGGLLVLTGIEKLRGKSIPEKWLIRLQLAGWVLVLTLLIMITWNDIRRWMS